MYSQSSVFLSFLVLVVFFLVTIEIPGFQTILPIMYDSGGELFDGQYEF